MRKVDGIINSNFDIWTPDFAKSKNIGFSFSYSWLSCLMRKDTRISEAARANIEDFLDV